MHHAAGVRRADARQQLHRGQASHVGGGLAHRGQRRIDVAGDRRVVEAADGDVARHHQAALARGADDAGRHVVVGGEDRRGRPLQVEQAVAGLDAGLERERPLHHQVLVVLDPCPSQRLAIALETPLACAVRGRALDVADAAVALGHQAGHQLTHGRGFVHHHADAAVRMLGRDAGEGHMVRFKEFQHHRIVRQGRNEHHAVRREVLEHHLQVVHLALARGPHRRQHQVVVVVAAGFQHAVLDFHQVVARRVVVDQRDHVGALPCQAARGQVGAVLQLLDDRHHPLPHFVPHVGLVVQHPRHGLHRHASGSGHIFDPTTHALPLPSRPRSRHDAGF